MSTTENQWSSVEKEIAHVALEKARSREIETLIETVRAASSSITTLDDMWRLHDFLSSKRHELDVEPLPLIQRI